MVCQEAQAANAQIIVKTTPSGYGTVKAGNSNYQATVTVAAAVGSKLIIYAKPNTGYKFVKWEDNSTAATRTVTVPNAKTTTYTATFAVATYTLTVTSNNTNYGTVTGGGTYNHGASATLTATPKTGYHFVQWSDGNKNANRTVTVTAAATYQATFAINTYTITFKNEDGTSLGTQTVNYNVKPTPPSNPTQAATAQYTYTFKAWSPTIAAATKDQTYTATYTSTVRSYTIRFLNGSSVLQSNTLKYGATPSYTGATPTKASTAQYSYTFNGWSPAIYAVNKAQDYAAQFSSTVRSYKITGASANTTMGTVSGTATKNYGQTVTLTATPKDCYKFVKWTDGNTTNPRTVTVTGTATYTATFEETISGNCGANGDNVKWYFNSCTGAMRIVGTGAMADYPDYATGRPWTKYKDAIKTLTVGSGVTTIGYDAFYECKNLTSVSLPNTITNVQNGFKYCTSLTTVNLPSSLTTIGQEAFRRTKLSSVVIPAGVTSIGSGSFWEISTLQDFYVSWTTASAIPTWDNITNGTASNITLHIPCGSGDLYRAANGWKNYTIRGDTQYTLTAKSPSSTQGTVSIDGGTAGTSVNKTTYCENTVTITATPKTGYHFVQWNDGNTSASRSVTVTGTATYQATFAINTYSITLASGNILQGQVTMQQIVNNVPIGYITNTSLSHNFDYGTVLTLTAEPYSCYRFKQWSDGNTERTRTVTVTAAKTYTATFETLSGTCGANGDNLTWTYCNGTLTIKGTGAMADYYSAVRPWEEYVSQITEVVLPSGITTISTDAFANCTALATVNFPSSLTNIGSRAFRNTSLTSVTLPEGLTALNHWVFRGCSNLTTVRLPKNMTTIASPGAFCDCSNLKDVYVLWTTLDQIPACTNQTNDIHNLSTKPTLHVPCGTTSLYQSKGWQNKSVFAEEIASGTCGTNVTWLLGCDSVLTISGTGTMNSYGSGSNVPWYTNRNDIKSVVINSGVTNIGNYAFCNCINLTSVSIPGSVTTIGSYAFDGCNSLPSVTIPSGVTTINYGAFRRCSSMATVTIPSSVTTIAGEAFYNTGLTDIYVSWMTAEAIPTWSSMTRYYDIILHVPCGTAAYYLAKAGWNNYTIRGGCNTTYTLTVTSDNSAFGLVQIDDGTPAASVSEQVYTDDSHLIKAVPVDACHQFVQWNDGNTDNPRKVMPNTNTTYTATFEEHQYSGTCGSYLAWVLECDSTLRISGTGAMSDFGYTSQPWKVIANRIKHVVIEEGVTTIGNYAFYQMKSIVDVTNPSTLKIIGTQAFHSCYGLESINFPDGLESIGRSSSGHGPFYDCHSLKSIYIPASVTFIAVDAFLRCYSATSIVVDPANTVYDSRDNCNAIIETAINKLWYGCQTTVIPDGVKTVAQFAFEYQHNLKSIRISSTVTSFGTTIFKECENLKDIYVEWTTTPPGYALTAWAEHANLDATITIHVPCGKKNLYTKSAYWNRHNIVDDHLKGGMCGAQGSNQTWMLSCDGHLDIKGIGAMADYSAGGAPWNEHKDAIHTVTFADGINTIGENAFAGFTNLTDIYSPWTENIPVLPASNNPQPSVTLHVPCTAISAYQAAGWGNYTIAPEYTASGTCGADGDNLTWTLCDSTLTISGTGAMADWVVEADCPWYQYRTQIYTINIDEGVTTIGAQAFVFSRISSITIPNSVTSIGGVAFACSNYLEEIVLPEGLTSIGYHAFYYGNVLKTVHIPSSVTSLGMGAFEGCELKDIYVEWQSSIPEWPTKFSKQYGVNLHVPCGTEALYQDAANWKKYTIEGEGTFTVTVQTATGDTSQGSVSISVP